MRAGCAFGFTEIDVHSVLSAAGIDKTYEECEQMLDLIDVSDVEAVALNGHDMDQQTEYAHQEILRQLQEQGVIPSRAAAPSLG